MKNNVLNHQNNTREDDNTSQVLKEARTSALEVAKYLLSLDPHKKYFTLKIISLGEEGSSLPTEGNFRLNKLLHMSQIFHCMEYGKPLFRERMEAFEHGALVYNVYMNFLQLYHLPTLTTALDKETQDFVSLIFNYFYSYKNDNETLKNFSHEDPAFKLGSQQEEGLMPLTPKIITYYTKFFDDTLAEIKGN